MTTGSTRCAVLALALGAARDDMLLGLLVGCEQVAAPPKSHNTSRRHPRAVEAAASPLSLVRLPPSPSPASPSRVPLLRPCCCPRVALHSSVFVPRRTVRPVSHQHLPHMGTLHDTLASACVAESCVTVHPSIPYPILLAGALKASLSSQSSGRLSKRLTSAEGGCTRANWFSH
jgi:hypothetical protein